jgi:C2 domain of PTEN tumour-suppressor protein
MSATWGDWFEGARIKTKELAEKAQEMAEVASKVAHEKATELAKQANEMRQNYDMELTSSIMTTINGPSESAQNARGTPIKSPPKKSVLDLVYVTENLVSMAFPYDPKKPGNAEGGNDINAVSRFLKQRHGCHFMIWNVSEEPYDYSLFGDQVLEYKFPGHPAPPLGLLFKICTSVESWLDADEKNVAVVHCLTGKGRTAALMACILTWIGEFSSPMEALQYVAQRRSISADFLTIPSQRRYVQYFSNMLDGVKPRSEPLLLRRVIINTIPNFGGKAGGENKEGCCPYVQLFKCGKLVATAAPPAGENSGTGAVELQWISISEGSVSFTVDSAVQGDLLLRCRHADPSGSRVSMFRAAFHTGYVPCGVLRLTKAQLDGACSDPRFDEEFFIDLIFAPVEKSSRNGTPGVTPSTPSDSGLIVDISSSDKYEQSLHRDTRFWDAVAARKTRGKKRKSRKYISNKTDQFSISDEMSSVNDDEMDSIRFSAVGGVDHAAVPSSAGGLYQMLYSLLSFIYLCTSTWTFVNLIFLIHLSLFLIVIFIILLFNLLIDKQN